MMEREHELDLAARVARERRRACEHHLLPEAPQHSQRAGLLALVLQQVERLRAAQAAAPAVPSDQK